MLPWVLALARRVWEPGSAKVATPRLHLVWGVREVEWVEWVRGGGLEEAVGSMRETIGVRIQVEVFVAAKRQPGRFPCPYLRPYIPLPTLVMPRLPSPELKGDERVFEIGEIAGGVRRLESGKRRWRSESR